MGDVMSDIKKGLVLEGGALKGIFSCGVMDVLMENGIESQHTFTLPTNILTSKNYDFAE